MAGDLVLQKLNASYGDSGVGKKEQEVVARV
jgi:hypothetical protein